MTLPPLKEKRKRKKHNFKFAKIIPGIEIVAVHGSNIEPRKRVKVIYNNNNYYNNNNNYNYILGPYLSAKWGVGCQRILHPQMGNL